MNQTKPANNGDILNCNKYLLKKQIQVLPTTQLLFSLAFPLFLSLSHTHSYTILTLERIHLTVLCLTHRLFCLCVSSSSEGAFLQEDTARLHTAALCLLVLHPSSFSSSPPFIILTPAARQLHLNSTPLFVTICFIMPPYPHIVQVSLPVVKSGGKNGPKEAEIRHFNSVRRHLVRCCLWLRRG